MIRDSIRAYKHIIWDWNGTLLDDVDVVIDAMNILLRRRKLPLLDRDRYKYIFTFPVKDYYTRLGFDFSLEPFDKLVTEYIFEYNKKQNQFRLHDGVKEVLTSAGRFVISQSILSASHEQELYDAVKGLNIDKFFIRIAGLSNHYAMSKVERGKDLLADLGLEPEEALLIGDTTHDYEVSKEIGCDSLLICSGHQSYRRLSNCNTSIIKSIMNVFDLLKEADSA